MTLAAESITHDYRGVPALVELTAAAAAGRVTAVLGPNAAGKSTLLRCLIGALRPVAGRALLDGEPAHRVPTRRLAERVAYVPQRPQVAAAFTVRQVVELGRYALPASRERIDAALGELELEGLGDRPFPALSVGQQQRVALARAVAQLAADGHLVLDEPTAAMDLRHARNALALLRRRAGSGATVLLAMHDLTAAAAIADDCWLLRDGRLVASGPTREVLDADRLRDVFGVAFEWVTADGGPPVLIAR